MIRPFICIAGKNNIAVDVLAYVIKHYGRNHIGVICNKTDTGENTFQRSLRRYAAMEGIREYRLDEMYGIENLVFLSLQFDRLVKPERFLNARLYNVHFSLLPQYKGMYTAIHCILKGEKFSGVTLHLIDSGIDTGDIIDQEKFEIGQADCKELYLKYIEHGTQIVLRNLRNIIEGTVVASPQCAIDSTYYSRNSIDYSSVHIDLNQTAEEISRQIRGFSFRGYQLPEVFGEAVIDCRILKSKSETKPGTVLMENEASKIISTIDYDIVLYFDRFHALLAACADGDLKEVIKICAISKHINEQDRNGWTPLIVATYNNHVEIVKYLIAAGADIRCTNNNGTNLLMYAKEAYKRYNNSELFSLFYNMGLSIEAEDYYGRTVMDYLNESRISIMNNGCLARGGYSNRRLIPLQYICISGMGGAAV